MLKAKSQPIPKAKKVRVGGLAERRMPQSEFGMPGKSFPMNDAIHQRLAISGAARSENAGNISPSTAAKIKAEARRKLGIKAK